MSGSASWVMMPVRWFSSWVWMKLPSITGAASGPMTWTARSPLSRIVLFAMRGED